MATTYDAKHGKVLSKYAGIPLPEGRRCITPRLGEDPTADPAYVTGVVLAGNMQGLLQSYHKDHMDYQLSLMEAKIAPAQETIKALEVAFNVHKNDTRRQLLLALSQDLISCISSIKSVFLQTNYQECTHFAASTTRNPQFFEQRFPR